MPCLLASPALSDAATLTGAATAGDLTLSNLQNSQAGKVAQFASLTGMYLEADFGAAAEVKYVWVGHTNSSVGGTVRVRAATSQANLTAAPGYDPGAQDIWSASDLDTWAARHAYIDLISTPQTFRWWRLDFADAANPDGYFQAGRLIFAIAPFIPTQEVILGALGPVERPVRIESQGGQIFASERAKKLAATFTIKCETRANAMGPLADLARLRGVSKDILAILRTDDPDHLQLHTIAGLMDEPLQIGDDNLPYYDLLIKMQEL